MSLHKPEIILFDLDGTLVDTVPDLALCVDLTMDKIGLPKRGENKVRNWVGNGVERLLKKALIDDMNGEPRESLYEEAFPVFMEIYTQNTDSNSKCYPGVSECLAYVKSKGYKLGCVTNKRTLFTNKLLGLYNDFWIVVSGDTLSKMKPDPLPLLHATEYFSVSPEKGLMIGDSVNDVDAARAAGLQVLCVTYGYNLGRDIREARPNVTVESLNEISNLI